MKKILAVLTVLTFVVAANAAGTVSLTETWGWNVAEPVNGTGGGVGTLPSAGTAYYNFRIAVAVDAGDDWTAINTNIALTNATFYQDVFGGDTSPNTALFGTFPDVEYDSCFLTPGTYPNATGGATSFANGPNWTATSVNADWFDSIAAPGGGNWYLASFTIIPDAGHEGDWTGTVSGAYTIASTGGQPFSYGFSVPLPEPASIALLALGSLALIRRR